MIFFRWGVIERQRGKDAKNEEFQPLRRTLALIFLGGENGEWSECSLWLTRQFFNNQSFYISSSTSNNKSVITAFSFFKSCRSQRGQDEYQIQCSQDSIEPGPNQEEYLRLGNPKGRQKQGVLVKVMTKQMKKTVFMEYARIFANAKNSNDKNAYIYQD